MRVVTGSARGKDRGQLPATLSIDHGELGSSGKVHHEVSTFGVRDSKSKEAFISDSDYPRHL